MQETRDAVDTAIIPLGILVGRTDEELVDPTRIGPVLLDHVVGRDAVALRLRHDVAVAVDHALGKEGREWLVNRDHLRVEEHFHEEP